jgi:hypothetical protein
MPLHGWGYLKLGQKIILFDVKDGKDLFVANEVEKCLPTM